MTEEISERWRRRRKLGRLLVLAAVLYTLLTTLLLVLLPMTNGFLLYVAPYTLMLAFLQSWFDARIPVLVLSLLPLAGWLLLVGGKKAGKPLVIVPQVLLLASGCAVTLFHLLVGAKIWSLPNVRSAALLFLPATLLPILTLWGLHRWLPKVTF